MIRVIFFGTDEFATRIFDELFRTSDIEVIALVTKPPAPKGRGMHVQQPLIISHAPDGLLILQPQKLDDVFAETMSELHPDLSVVVEYGKIIPQIVLDIPRMKTWNIHPSLLPKYRGPSPVTSAILNGDTQTGTSIMLLDAQMDHGPIFAQETIAIDANETSFSLRDKLANLSASLLIKTIRAVVEGLEPEEQDHRIATSTKKFDSADFQLNFTNDALTVLRRIRAFPGEAMFTLSSGKTCKVFSASIAFLSKSYTRTPGDFFCDKKHWYVQCADVPISLDEVLPEGKKRMSGIAFARGYRF